ncbi:MAG: S8 family serine peptidase, partial [Dehalococcoidia bacterium]|nr:S8 family serine peptidase [Dehalococcoidia bacterium]
ELRQIPAETNGVIAVSAVDRRSNRASYSNGGRPHNDVSAPGGGTAAGGCGQYVLSTFPTIHGSYGCISGTSMASPHAAGVAALIISQFGDLRPAAVERIMRRTSIDIEAPGYDRCFGTGRVDALRAVHNRQGPVRQLALCPRYSND